MFKKFLYRSYRFTSSIKYGLNRRFTKSGQLALACLVLSAGLGLDTNVTVAYQGFTFLFFLLAFALIACLFFRARVTARRVLPRFGTAGSAFNYRVILRNERPRKERGVLIFDDLADPRPSFEDFAQTPEPGEAKRNFLDRTFLYYRWSWLIARNQMVKLREREAPELPSRGACEVPCEMTPRRRGRLSFTSVSLGRPDPFGLFRAFVRADAEQSVLILPKRYHVPPVALPGTLKYQQGGVAFASSVGQSEEFVSLRDYRPGDPLRHIHWKSWARTGRPIVKEYQDEFFVRHALVLDTFAKGVGGDVFEEAVSVAASFACTIQTQESLLDLLFVGSQAYCFTAGRGVAHTDQMLEILASVETCKQKPFGSLKNLVLDHIGAVSGCICVLLSWDEERRSLVTNLRALGVPVLVLVISESGTTEKLDPGPLRDHPEWFRQLEAGRVAEGLSKL